MSETVRFRHLDENGNVLSEGEAHGERIQPCCVYYRIPDGVAMCDGETLELTYPHLR